jgi:phytoene synthase
MTSLAVPDTLEASFAECRTITKREARNFYYGLRLTPEPRRSAIYSVYAWMRAVDDCADSPGSVDFKRNALREFADRTDAALESGCDPSEESFWPAFIDTVQRYGLDPHTFRDVIRGMEDDLETDASVADITFETRADVEQYCYRVASTVGLICLRIWGLRDCVSQEEADALAIQRGLAFQLTNILRDVGRDYDDGRVYIARRDFEAHDLTPAQLRSWSPADRSRDLVLDLSRWAQSAYDGSSSLETMVDPACAPAMWAMTRIYHSLLEIVEREPSRVVGVQRIRVPSYRKATIGVRAVLGAGRRA